MRGCRSRIEGRRGARRGLEDCGIGAGLSTIDPWIWALGLIAMSLVVHASGVVMMGLVTLRLRNRLRARGLGLRAALPIVMGVIAGIGVLLTALHGIEALMWAVAYLHLGAVGSAADAMLYSVDAMTTRGASGIVLAAPWRMMGALEAADGMLLFGISTAFMYAMFDAFWGMIAERRLGGVEGDQG